MSDVIKNLQETLITDIIENLQDRLYGMSPDEMLQYFKDDGDLERYNTLYEAVHGPLFDQFKLSHHVKLDFYSFKADEWHSLRGDFLVDLCANPKGLEEVLKQQLKTYIGNPKFEDLTIEYK